MSFGLFGMLGVNRSCVLVVLSALSAVAAGACAGDVGIPPSVIDPGNRPPVLGTPSAITDVNVPVTLDVLDAASDPEHDGLTVVFAVAGPHAVAINDHQTITVTPAPGFVGELTLSYSVSDGHQIVDGRASVTVRSENRPPIAIDFPLDVPRN